MGGIRELSSTGDLAEAFREAGPRPLWIFKHSLTCGASSWALGDYRRYVEARQSGDEIFCLVEVQRARPVSDEIARMTGIGHETPQALLFLSGRVVWEGSHRAITAGALEAAVEVCGETRKGGPR